MNTQQASFLGDAVDIYETARKRFGTWPVTVLDVDHSNKLYRQLKAEIGDLGQARAECFRKKVDDKSVYGGKFTESVFNPQIAVWLLNLFAPKAGRCFDPFGGGGTRAILASKHGLNYTGLEIRQEETQAVRERCEAAGVKATIITADSQRATDHVEKDSADFLLTCPPYWDMEKYKGGNGDLSMAKTYNDFLDMLQLVIRESFLILKPDALSVWVVGLHRDKTGELLALNHDIAQLHRWSGFTFKEEIVLAHKNNGAIQRVGNFEKGNRFLIRLHEYALVFRR